jgi:iron(III) transport system substrate-binding protein
MDEMNFKKMAAAFLTGACMLTAIGCGGGGGGEKPKDAKAEQSLKGKEVVLYVSFHEDTTKELAKGFKEKTGCEVKFIRLPTGEAVARLIAEKDAPKADVWLGGTIDAHEKMKAEGITTKYTSPDEKNLPAAYVDKDGFWKGTYLETLAIGVNEARFNKEFKGKVEMPTKLEDLLNPAFKGEIIMPDPAKSGTGSTFLTSVVQCMGEEKGLELLKGIKANVAQLTPSGFTPAQKCGAGEFLITVNFLSDQMNVSNKGQKIISTVFPNAGWTLCGVSKLKGAPHDAAANAFIDYMMSKEAGDAMVKTANGIACNPKSITPAGSKPLNELPLYKDYDFAKAGKEKDALTAKFAGL